MLYDHFFVAFRLHSILAFLLSVWQVEAWLKLDIMGVVEEPVSTTAKKHDGLLTYSHSTDTPE